MIGDWKDEYNHHRRPLPVGMKRASYSEADLDDALLRERSLLYVAATRARDVLAVSYHGTRSPLLG